MQQLFISDKSTFSNWQFLIIWPNLINQSWQHWFPALLARPFILTSITALLRSSPPPSPPYSCSSECDLTNDANVKWEETTRYIRSIVLDAPSNVFKRNFIVLLCIQWCQLENFNAFHYLQLCFGFFQWELVNEKICLD